MSKKNSGANIRDIINNTREMVGKETKGNPEKESPESHAVEMPNSPYVQIGAFREQDGTANVVSALEYAGIGVVVRTKFLHGNSITVSEVFIPGVSVRNGLIVRSPLYTR